MAKHNQPDKPTEFPKPDKPEEIILPVEPEEPLAIPKESPIIIPDKEAIEAPPYKFPIPGEGPLGDGSFLTGFTG